MKRDIERIIDRELRRGEQQRRIKDKDLYEIVEEVFDSSTLTILMDLQRRGCIRRIKGVVSAGKESRVYWGVDNSNRDLAVKIYLTLTSEFRRSMWKYLAGDPRFEKYKGLSPKKLIYMWARKEYSNLKRLYRAGVNVPKPICQSGNILIMGFIGDNGSRAPLLKEFYEYHKPTPEHMERIFKDVLNNVRRMYIEAELIHGDLSEYNLMIHNGEIYIIDVSQAILNTHPNAKTFLKNDLYNISKFFTKAGVEVPPLNELYRYITGALVDNDL